MPNIMKTIVLRINQVFPTFVQSGGSSRLRQIIPSDFWSFNDCTGLSTLEYCGGFYWQKSSIDRSLVFPEIFSEFS